jgi:hypothetical protein
MKLQEAIEASPLRAAAFPAVGDILRLEDGRTYWWLQTKYVDRGKDLHPDFLASDDWYPFTRVDLMPVNSRKDSGL